MENGTGKLDRYTIEAELAQSPICSVYRASEASLQRPVLIKKLHPQMAREEDIRSRFEREAKVCARLSHENIVSIYGYHADPDLTMLVLEYVDGPNLGALIAERGRLDWRVVVAILAGIAKGLAFAHSKGVIHRDLKPDNILLSRSGQVKIADFGLATLEDAPKLTRQGTVLGTPAYLPPEVVYGGVVDTRSDLFSLGATIYEALTGLAVFRGDNFTETMNRILKTVPPKPSAAAPEIPPELDQIVLRLLEKQPSKRFASADQLLEEVRSLAAQRSVPLDSEFIKGFLSQTGDNGDAKRASFEVEPGGTKSSQAFKRFGYKSPVWTAIAVTLGVLLILAAVLMPRGDDYINTRIPNADKLLDIIRRQRTKMSIPPPVQPEPRLKARPAVTPDKPATKNEQNRTPRRTNSEEPNRLMFESTAADSARTGRLIVTVKPWANVFINNESHGQTPLAEPIELKAGDHMLTLSNNEFPAPVVRHITIKPGGAAHIEVDLWKEFAVFYIRSVKPWAEIFINGVSYGHTPRARPIILPFGSYLFELRNPDYNIWRREYTVNKENTPVEINATLEPLAADGASRK